MKKKIKSPIRELRKITGRTQGEFAAMVGASKDAVVSWEVGRNQLSESFAQRIAFATGVEAKSLLRHKGPLLGRGFAGRLVPYTKELYEKHMKSRTGRSDQVNARGHLKNCVEALELLFVAAAEPVRGNKGQRLPSVVQSFMQWCEATRKDFHLEKGIEQQLKRQGSKLTLTHTWGQWRGMEKEDPGRWRVMGVQDKTPKTEGERTSPG